MAEGHIDAVEALEDDDEIFVYMGGDQRVPGGIRRARIHEDVKIILEQAFQDCWRLISVEFHDGIEIIEKYAFLWCTSLRSVKLLGVKVIKAKAFCNCTALTDVEFGDKLEIIGQEAFGSCTLLRNITMPQVKRIGGWAFECCKLTDLELPEELEILHENAFGGCEYLRRIALPLKDGMIGVDVFDDCWNLITVDLVGGVHKTVSSLHLERWRDEMKGEINRINELLPYNVYKTSTILLWISKVIIRLNHYKAEHQKLLKEATTLLELALWKANLDDKEGGALEKEGVRTTRGQRKRARKEISITSGASIVIKNVLPFLEMK